MKKDDDKSKLLDDILTDRKFGEELRARCLSELQTKKNHTSLRRALVAVASIAAVIGWVVLLRSPSTTPDSLGIAGLTVVHTRSSSLPELLRTPPAPSLPEKVSDTEFLALMKGRSCALVSLNNGRKVLLMLDEQADIVL